jgi:hypothetical protein
MQTRKGLQLLLSLVAIGSLTSLSESAHAFSNCPIAFNDRTGFEILDPSQAYGFMIPAGGPGGVWYYNQCSTTGDWFYFDEDPATAYNHFHFPAEDMSINCVTTDSQWPNGVMGRMTNGTCVPVDPLATERFVHNHWGDQLLRFQDLSSPPYRWRPAQIYVLSGSADAKVVMKAENGVFWTWAPLT